jgi:hypothetical protein
MPGPAVDERYPGPSTRDFPARARGGRRIGGFVPRRELASIRAANRLRSAPRVGFDPRRELASIRATNWVDRRIDQAAFKMEDRAVRAGVTQSIMGVRLVERMASIRCGGGFNPRQEWLRSVATRSGRVVAVTPPRIGFVPSRERLRSVPRMASIRRDERSIGEVGPRLRGVVSMILCSLAMSDVPGTGRVEPIGDRRGATALDLFLDKIAAGGSGLTHFSPTNARKPEGARFVRGPIPLTPALSQREREPEECPLPLGEGGRRPGEGPLRSR